MTRRACAGHESCFRPPGKQNMQLPHAAPCHLPTKSSAPGLPFPPVFGLSGARQLGWPGQAMLRRVHWRKEAGQEVPAASSQLLRGIRGRALSPLQDGADARGLLSSPCQAPREGDQHRSSGGCRLRGCCAGGEEESFRVSRKCRGEQPMAPVKKCQCSWDAGFLRTCL